MNDPKRERSTGNLPELFTVAEWKALGKELELTPRQANVARLICRGLRKDAIAQELGLKSNTIRMHVHALYQRLGVHDKVGVVVTLVLLHRKLGRR